MSAFDISKHMNLLESLQNAPPSVAIIDADVYEKVAVLHNFVVPEEMRGKGVGKREYEKWEASLPSSVELVKLFAADYDGSGNSDGFWESMGYDYQFAETDDYEASHMMWKGVNGHPTPSPIEPDDLDESITEAAQRGVSLTESVSNDTLYHGTSIIGFCGIAKNNKLENYSDEGQTSFTLDFDVAKTFTSSAVENTKHGQLGQFPDYWADEERQIRDPDYRPHYGDGRYLSYKAEMVAGGTGVIIAFSRSALLRDYEFFSAGFDSEGTKRRDLGKGFDGSEQEEYTMVPVKNLDKYVKRIHMDRAAFKKYSEYVRHHLGDGDYADFVRTYIGDDELKREFAYSLDRLAAGEKWMSRFG